MLFIGAGNKGKEGLTMLVLYRW